MGNMVNMYTVVPIELAMDLKEKRRIKDYNTLPQLNTAILDAVREYMTENVGFSELPMACLSLNRRASAMDSTELFQYLPINNRENVLFRLKVPEDMVITVSYDILLSMSKSADECGNDPDEIEIIKEDFKDLLILGDGGYMDSDEEAISFIPFLDYNCCEFYAKFDENFHTSELEIPGIKKFSLAKLSAFID